MKNPRVHWYLGLFIRPHHLQAADRFWMETVHTSESWDHPYGYGVHAIAYSQDALASGRFRVESLEARLRDGTLVRLNDGEELEINLKQAFESASDVEGDSAR